MLGSLNRISDAIYTVGLLFSGTVEIRIIRRFRKSRTRVPTYIYRALFPLSLSVNKTPSHVQEPAIDGVDLGSATPACSTGKKQGPEPNLDYSRAAEQLFREARDRHVLEVIRRLKQRINDEDELREYRLRTREGFEDKIGRARDDLGEWKKYARWEESQNDFVRARSVWERALQVDYRDHSLWAGYAEFEMRNKFIDYARNVWDRAVELLPRVHQLWYKYIHMDMEHKLGNVAAARQIYERWMKWAPDESIWLSYISFEHKYKETNQARQIYERFVQCHPTATAWLKYAEFEMTNKQINRERSVYECAVEKLSEDEEADKLFVAFAEFEERCKETERARCIYEYALNHIPKGRAEELYRKFTAFEKRVKDNKERVRDVYERAIANVPPADEKRYWARYLYLWIEYALCEELEARDMETTREAYRRCLKLIPHKRFSFGKIWIMAANFELRQMNLTGARKILGNAIGMAPKGKVFVKYIEMEMRMGNLDRRRKLYNRYLEWAPGSSFAWKKYGEFEEHVCQTERARAVFEVGIGQKVLDVPEDLFKAYIEFETSEGEYERVRALYERLLERTQHLRVWIRYAQFEASLVSKEEEEGGGGKEEDEDCIQQKKLCVARARRVFERALEYLEQQGQT
ncbi:hypothetical protein WN944_018190 [Citrus x changshan-huyou]|uniref:Pre-mRNA-splicing factor Syf1-like N-terminal HAT-repeats domain-containing protein n=1 Tax=Citrus x changshan-huyou TaxID=2935761 RepID=A0AAP0QI90_9ROSI